MPVEVPVPLQQKKMRENGAEVPSGLFKTVVMPDATMGSSVRSIDGANAPGLGDLRVPVPTINKTPAGMTVTTVESTLPKATDFAKSAPRQGDIFSKVLGEVKKQKKKIGGEDEASRKKAEEWRKADDSFSNGNCVELAMLEQNVGIRDSKNKMGPIITVSPNSLNTFLKSIRQGEFSN